MKLLPNSAFGKGYTLGIIIAFGVVLINQLIGWKFNPFMMFIIYYLFYRIFDSTEFDETINNTIKKKKGSRGKK